MLLSKQVRTSILEAPPGQDFRLWAARPSSQTFQGSASFCALPLSCTRPGLLHSHWDMATAPHLVLDGLCPPFLPPALNRRTLSVMFDDPGMRCIVHALAHATLPRPAPTDLTASSHTTLPNPTPSSAMLTCFPQTSQGPTSGPLNLPCCLTALLSAALPPSFTPQREAWALNPTLDPHKCLPNTLFFPECSPSIST